MITLLLALLLQSASTRSLIISKLDEVREYKLGKYLINNVLIANLSIEDGDKERKTVSGEPEASRTIGRFWCRWEDAIRNILKKYYVMAWTGFIRITNVSSEWFFENGDNDWFYKMRGNP